MYSIIGADGQLYGPVSLDVLKQWCQQERVIPTTNLIVSGTSQTLRASDLRELQPYFVYHPPTQVQNSPFQSPGPYGQTQGPTFQSQGPTYGSPSPFHQPNYYGQPGAYGVAAPKSKMVAGLLALIFGPFAIHRFYLGYTKEGTTMLALTVASIFLCWVGVIATSIWAFVDAIKIFSGSMPDAQGQPLV